MLYYIVYHIKQCMSGIRLPEIISKLTLEIVASAIIVHPSAGTSERRNGDQRTGSLGWRSFEKRFEEIRRRIGLDD